MLSNYFKTITTILCIIMLITLTACEKKGQDKSYDVFDSDGKIATTVDLDSDTSEKNNSIESKKTDKLKTISREDFKSAASKLGEIQDVSKDVGFDAIAVHGNDMNYIFMLLENEAAAKSMIFSSSDPGSENIKITKCGNNYDFYEEDAKIKDNNGTSFFGCYLRVDNMLILVTGPSSDKRTTKKNAKTFFSSLGYSLP